MRKEHLDELCRAQWLEPDVTQAITFEIIHPDEPRIGGIPVRIVDEPIELPLLTFVVPNASLE